MLRIAPMLIPATLPEGSIYQGRISRIADIARVADEVGLDAISVSEHVLMGSRKETFPWGAFPHQLNEPLPEPLALLAFLAGVTRQIQLISALLIAPLRPPALLAKTAATVHALSEGRLVLGVTTSWQETEYQALGVSFADRGALLDDCIGACKALWGSAPAAYHSQTVNFDGMYCEPRPDHADDIPIWFGGKLTPRLVRRVSRWGHGWLPAWGPWEGQGLWPAIDKPGTRETIRDGTRRIQLAMDVVGRDPSAWDVGYFLRPNGRELRRALEEDLPLMAAAGINVIRIRANAYESELEKIPAFLEDLARSFEPFRALEPAR